MEEEHKQQQEHHAEDFVTICRSIYRNQYEGKGDLSGDGELDDFVEKKLLPQEKYLGIDFALMVSFVFGIDIHIVSNTKPASGQSTFSYGVDSLPRLMKSMKQSVRSLSTSSLI